MIGFAVQPVDALLIIPALSALVLAFPSGYRLTSRINLISCGAVFLFAVALLFNRPAASNYLFVDDLNVVFVVLSTFIRIHDERL